MIGGDFQIMDALKNNNNYDCKIHALIGSGDFVFTDTGRSALAIALEDIKLKYSFNPPDLSVTQYLIII